MSELFAPVCSISATKRRKFFWAAWWSGPPARAPFRKPDAFGGGARSRDEALSMAEKAAGMPLVVVEALWAKAVLRTSLGLPPFAASEADHQSPVAATRRDGPSVWALLGVSQTATPAEVKRAFRKKALETHPDHGGDALMFQKVRAAYDEALRRSARPRKQAKKPKPP